jgi:serine/threonine-protein kinase
MLGDRRTAIAELQRALSLAPHHPDVPFRAAIVYNQLGDQQQALGWLKKAVAANFFLTTVRDTPDFDHLRSDPAFKALVPAA